MQPGMTLLLVTNSADTCSPLDARLELRLAGIWVIAVHCTCRLPPIDRVRRSNTQHYTTLFTCWPTFSEGPPSWGNTSSMTVDLQEVAALLAVFCSLSYCYPFDRP